MGTIDIKAAFYEVQKRGLFSGINRYKYAINIEDSLQLVEKIGKQRNPNFIIDKENRFAYENIIRWLHGDESMKAIHPETKKEIPGDLLKGLYIAGSTGSGKSWCMEVLLAYVDVMKFRIDLGDSKGRLLWWRIVRADDIVASFIETTSIEAYKKVKILCIQDFGSEPLEAVSMGNRMNVLRKLIEFRGDRSDYLTFFTSNYSINNPHIAEHYDERVASRLAEMCNYFEIKGKDRRKM